MHLLLGLLAMLGAAFLMNLAFGGFHPGFDNQPVAHTDGLWNFLGMVTAGMAFALAGGCPGRQLFLAGEGDCDAAVFATGLLVGAAMAHNFGTASSRCGYRTLRHPRYTHRLCGLSSDWLSEQQKGIRSAVMTKEINTCGLSCPQPVLMVHEAIRAGEGELDVLTDNEASRENVARAAEKQGFSRNPR